MVYVGICDDDINQVELTYKCVKEFFEREKIDCEIIATTYGAELLKSASLYDIVFLDIEIKNEDGIEIGKLLRKSNKASKLVYITLHTKYMVRALCTHFFDYLSKPIECEDIELKLHESLEYLKEERKTVSIIDLKGKRHVFKVSEIIYVEGDNHFINVYTDNEERVSRLNYTLKEFYEKLAAVKKFSFVRRECIVHFRHIVNIKNDTLTMENGDDIRISRRRKASFEADWKEYEESESL